jgi:neural Wiskott-Aldrich syndrome protein
MPTKFSSLKTLLAAFAVAGGVGVACSSHQRQPESTTIAQAPLGQSTAALPSDPSVAPPDAAEAPEQEIGPVHSLSSGAATPPASGTPTNPNTPPPTPASPNAPASPPAPNPMPPSGGAPPSIPPTGGAPAPTPLSSIRGESTSQVGARPRDGATANVASVRPMIAPSTVPEARGTFLEPLDPYQARSDGGVTPPSPTPVRDAGVTPPAPNRDAGVAPPRDGGVAPIRDGGVGPGGRGDAGIVNPIRGRGDGGLR